MATQPHPLSYYLKLEYPYTVVPDDGSFFIEFPDLPGCMTQVDEAGDIAAMAEEIRTLWIEGEYEDGHSIPEPAPDSRYSGKFMTRIPKSLHRELAITAKSEGMSLNAYVGYLLAHRDVAARLDARLTRLETRRSSLDEEGPQQAAGDCDAAPRGSSGNAGKRSRLKAV